MKKLILAISILGLLVAAAWLYQDLTKVKYGVITYRTNISDRKAEAIVEEAHFAVSIEEVKILTNNDSKLFFNEKVSKWYRANNFSKSDLPDKSSKKGIQTYVFNEYDSKAIEIQKVSEAVLYSIIEEKEEITFVETDNVFQVLGYSCNEVILIDKAGVPTIRFLVASKIPYPIGPSIYAYEQKAILRVDDLLDQNEILFEAISIEKISTNEVLSTRPQLDKMYSKTEFLEMMEV